MTWYPVRTSSARWLERWLERCPGRRPGRRLGPWPVTLLLATLLAAAPVQARESDLDQPVDIRADRSQYDERAGRQVLEGNVEITQGTMLIRADRIEVSLRDGQLARIEGNGSPLVFEQDNEAGERMQGTAGRIVYDAIAGSLVLEGEATLSQPRQKLQSERIVFDTRTQTVSAEGGPSVGDGQPPGRVTIRLEPPARDAR